MNVDEVPASEYAFNDTKQMKHFALEAEMNRNYDLAAYYYQEVKSSFLTSLSFSLHKKRRKFTYHVL